VQQNTENLMQRKVPDIIQVTHEKEDPQPIIRVIPIQFVGKKSGSSGITTAPGSVQFSFGSSLFGRKPVDIETVKPGKSTQIPVVQTGKPSIQIPVQHVASRTPRQQQTPINIGGTKSTMQSHEIPITFSNQKLRGSPRFMADPFAQRGFGLSGFGQRSNMADFFGRSLLLQPSDYMKDMEEMMKRNFWFIE